MLFRSLDLSKEKSALVIGVNENSTLTSGSGDDSIFAYAGSHVDAGAGKNYIEIEERGASDDGVAIAMSDGKNTIANFNAGFEDTSDKLFFSVNDRVSLKFDGANVSVQTNDAWHGVLSDVEGNADFVNLLLADANGPVKVAVAQENAVIAVEDELADLYIGENSAVDFTNYDGAVMANIGTEENSIGAGEIIFSGINQIINVIERIKVSDNVYSVFGKHFGMQVNYISRLRI